VRDALKELDWIKTNGFIVETIKIVANAILALITATAGWSWYWGFSLVNQVLWDNWKRRIEAAQ
jgi:hypothetical protein